MTTRVIDLFLDPGDHASRPASATVPVGSLYPCTDHGIERNDADASWPLWNTGVVQSVVAGANVSVDSTDPANPIVSSSGGGGGGSTYELPPVRLVAPGNVNLSTGLVNGTVLDGVTIATGDRIFCPAQSTGSQVGIYVAPATGAASRSSDASTTGQLITGSTVTALEGRIGARSQWTLMTTGTITIGTTAQAWQRIAGEFRYIPTQTSSMVAAGSGPANFGGDAHAIYGARAGGYNLASVSVSAMTAFGTEALFNANASNATGFGNSALRTLTFGADNSAFGKAAGAANSGGATTDATTSGARNSLFGAYALAGNSVSSACAFGWNSNAKFDNTSALGTSTTGTQTFQTHTGPRAFAMTKMATPHTTSGSANDIELMADVDGSGNLILKALLDSKVIPLAHELGATYVPVFTTAGRPSASAVGDGAMYRDSTVSKLAISDGTGWFDTLGTAI